jgi:hypothetical protein
MLFHDFFDEQRGREINRIQVFEVYTSEQAHNAVDTIESALDCVVTYVRATFDNNLNVGG